mgnify:CR=1 FL=1
MPLMVRVYGLHSPKQYRRAEVLSMQGPPQDQSYTLRFSDGHIEDVLSDYVVEDEGQPGEEVGPECPE